MSDRAVSRRTQRREKAAMIIDAELRDVPITDATIIVRELAELRLPELCEQARRSKP